jgi:hypothetical protein
MFEQQTGILQTRSNWRHVMLQIEGVGKGYLKEGMVA